MLTAAYVARWPLDARQLHDMNSRFCHSQITHGSQWTATLATCQIWPFPLFHGSGYAKEKAPFGFALCYTGFAFEGGRGAGWESDLGVRSKTYRLPANGSSYMLGPVANPEACVQSPDVGPYRPVALPVPAMATRWPC